MNAQKIALRGTGAALFAAGLWFAPTSCREARDPALDRGATVVMAVADVGVMKPDEDLDFLTFLPLATLDEHGELEGRLARSWEHSADFKEWTYHLRTDVRWGDGKPVTARDVKFTLDLLAKAGTGYTGINATIVDDSTVRIRAANPHYIDDIVYYPEHLLAALDPATFWEWEFWTHPVGNGPFRFVRYLPERLIEFEANPKYYKGQPRVQRVIVKFVGSLRRDFGRGNPLGYANGEAFELIDRLQQTADPDDEDRIYRKIRKYF